MLVTNPPSSSAELTCNDEGDDTLPGRVVEEELPLGERHLGLLLVPHLHQNCTVLVV